MYMAGYNGYFTQKHFEEYVGRECDRHPLDTVRIIIDWLKSNHAGQEFSSDGMVRRFLPELGLDHVLDWIKKRTTGLGKIALRDRFVWVFASHSLSHKLRVFALRLFAIVHRSDHSAFASIAEISVSHTMRKCECEHENHAETVKKHSETGFCNYIK